MQRLGISQSAHIGYFGTYPKDIFLFYHPLLTCQQVHHAPPVESGIVRYPVTTLVF